MDEMGEGANAEEQFVLNLIEEDMTIKRSIDIRGGGNFEVDLDMTSLFVFLNERLILIGREQVYFLVDLEGDEGRPSFERLMSSTYLESYSGEEFTERVTFYRPNDDGKLYFYDIERFVRERMLGQGEDMGEDEVQKDEN
jgi:hypothetical protein